ncbi:MAG: RNA polymerase sigma factor [Clostridia bacterium]|nr:sigma-70 family RNA polymerase sigma factor [Clostridium sp.]
MKNLDERNQLIIQYINKNQEKLYRLVFSYIKDEEQSLDVIQNTILKALDNLEKLREEKYLETWIYRIAINESLKYLKKQKNEPIFNIQDYEISSEEFENKDITDVMDLYKAIDSLKPKLKTVIILRFFEDKSLAEISKITNSNLSTVKTRLYKALKELKIKIGKDEL